MMICLGALAAESRAIVCIADRYMTYGQELMGETDSVKIVPIVEGRLYALIAGGDEAIGRLLSSLASEENLGEDRGATQNRCEEIYREAEQQILEMRFLNPFIKSAEYSAAIQKEKVNDVIKSIAEAIEKDRTSQDPTFNCSLILCGFDKEAKPYLLNLKRHGACVDHALTGFCVAGSGSWYALQKLLDSEWERRFPLDRAIFELFDSKVQAEYDQGVGGNWDAIVITAKGCKTLPEDLKTMLDRVYVQRNRSPYMTYNSKEHIPLPPKDWKKKLKEFTDSIEI